MRIERLNSDTIRILISGEDLRNWNIDFTSIGKNSKEAQEMFWAAIRQAEYDVGFFADGAHLLVEATQNAKDGFVMHITKIPGGKGVEFVEHRRRSRLINLPSYIYKFEEFEDLCCAMKCIEPMFEGESSLHKFNESFFLHMLPYEGSASMELHNTLSEYAQKVSEAYVAEGFLNEYAMSMIENNAVETLAEYF